MAELADGTGGTFVQNTNDLARGLHELSAAPEVYYVLGFSPQNLKLDGSYHSLKVTVKIPAGPEREGAPRLLCARGIFRAPMKMPKKRSRRRCFRAKRCAIFRPKCTRSFSSRARTEARLVVVSRIDVRKLQFRKVDGRNGDDVMIVSGLFDRNGNYLQSVSKTLKMRLLDDDAAKAS